jgi:dTDP-4-dehydrorhamnose reductase
VILRTAWVYAPYGKNFVRTMLALAETRDEVWVVADQSGCPTYAPDIADAIIRIAHNLLKDRSDPRMRGIFHLAGTGETTRAGLAEAIFEYLAGKGQRRPRIDSDMLVVCALKISQLTDGVMPPTYESVH